MADQTPAIVPADLFTKVGTSEATHQAVEQALSRMQIATLAHSDVTVLDEGYVDVDTIDSLIVTHINGEEGIPNQDVVVEYLKGNQRMVVPAMLAMSVDETLPGWSDANTTLVSRYHKLTTQTYEQLKNLCVVGQSLAVARTAIDALTAPVRPAAGRARYPTWQLKEYYKSEDGEVPTDKETITVFAYISSACQMNADVRDLGILMQDDMVKTDDAWKTADTVKNVVVRLHPYTLTCAAALNLDRVNNYSLAAWVRAYGISVGIMPARSSQTVAEYAFSTRMPTVDSRKTVTKFNREYARNLSEICCNILAMFGLFHLNKDHTHRTNDAAMQRIQRSYIGAIRTATFDSINESMQAHAEEIARTAAHPFGLAQTYWLALAMGHLGKLAAPLALRTSTCPPPVQRLLMVNAMLQEWASLPAGQLLNGAYADEFDIIVQEVEVIRKSPPSYSGLFRLYGIDKIVRMSPRAVNAVAALVPPIYGYVMLTHVSPTQERSGPALALSWNNITRDHNAVLDGWRNLWSRYLEGMETMSMPEFATGTKLAQDDYKRALEAAKARQLE